MNLYEYQAKGLLRNYGLAVPEGFVCSTPGEAEAAAERLGGQTCVVKAQIHAGGRAKSGGVKFASSSIEARRYAAALLGVPLVTPQTDAKGETVRKVYVENVCSISSEYYLSILVDRSKKALALVASSQGGTAIEELARANPEKIIKSYVESGLDLRSSQCMEIALGLGLTCAQAEKFSELLARLAKLFVERDLLLFEINPLALTTESEFAAIDAKCIVDDNALYRQPDLRCCIDCQEFDLKDLRASGVGLSFVALEGNIGVMVNGAGLAMATMDLIKRFGGVPANFLDVGGGVSTEAVAEAFSIILEDAKVKAILVNIFGGIVKCDVIAQGIINAAAKLQVKVPLVVRLQGTNVIEGRKLLADSGLRVVAADTMAEAASCVVRASNGQI
jgi:succinyl-CoA synthetase beta subunit